MICEKQKCTGCFACYNICPKNAIAMKEDEYGFVYPVIDEEKCINCNLCKKICPSLSEKKGNKPKKAYAMWNLDENIRKNSTSGGAATTFYTYVLSKGGIGYGCSNIEQGVVKYIKITNMQELEKIKGSKYVHAYIEDAYKQIKSDLLNELQVIFVGTPCQVAGLKSYLGKEYDNLITVDIVCHGVPSQKLLREELQEEIGNLPMDKITFRDESGYNFRIFQAGKEIRNQEAKENYYLSLFLSGLCQRENCYECQYANDSRVSDITIGDFWGIQGEKFEKEHAKGISVILPITEKGEEFIEEIKNNMNIFLEEKPVDEAVKGNAQLNRPARKHKNHDKFKKDYLILGYKQSTKKYLKKDIQIYKIKKALKNNKIISNLYYKIRKRK